MTTPNYRKILDALAFKVVHKQPEIPKVTLAISNTENMASMPSRVTYRVANKKSTGTKYTEKPEYNKTGIDEKYPYLMGGGY